MTGFSRWTVLVAFAWLGAGETAMAAGCQAHSPPHRVSVLELYTSEGCSSCPPADRWLSSLPQQGISTSMVIPLAFHVDYWNQLGWPDRFSQSAFSERQRRLNDRLKSGVIFTPQLVLDGQDLRLIGGMEKLRNTVAAANRRPAAAEIELHVEPRTQGFSVSARVLVREIALRPQAEAWIAVFENGLSSRVSRGENAGRQLYHDFVVRELLGPFAIDSEGRAQIRQATHDSADWNPANVHVAVFVQRKDNGESLQAAVAPLACRS
jgi:hypothetical protein